MPKIHKTNVDPASKKTVSASFDVSSLHNSPRQRRSQNLTLRVLRATESLIRSVGHDGLTIAMIAEEADVSIGGLYGRFRNREEIITAVNRQLLQRLQEESENWIASSARNPFAALRQFLDGLIEFFHIHGALFPVQSNSVDAEIINDAAAIEKILRTILEKSLSEHQNTLAGVDVKSFAAMAVHLCLASLLRESGTPNKLEGRKMTWPVLTEYLPQVIEAYLHSLIGKAIERDGDKVA